MSLSSKNSLVAGKRRSPGQNPNTLEFGSLMFWSQMDEVHTPTCLLLSTTCSGAEDSPVTLRTTLHLHHQTLTLVNSLILGSLWGREGVGVLHNNNSKHGLRISRTKWFSALSKEKLSNRAIRKCCFKNNPSHPTQKNPVVSDSVWES